MTNATLLDHCMQRATTDVMSDELGLGDDSTISRPEIARLLWPIVRRASNSAALIIEWATALDDLGIDDLGAEQFVTWTTSSRSTVYRRLQDFHSLYPHLENPNSLALAVLAEARRRGERPNLQLKLALAS